MDQQQMIDRIYHSQRFQEIITIEPRITEVLDRAKQIRLTSDYQWYPTYVSFKHELVPLVGWEAEQEAISDCEDYDLIMGLMDMILPLDCNELFPDGGSPSDPNHPCYCEDAYYYVEIEADQSSDNQTGR